MIQPSSPRSRMYADGPQVVALPPLDQRWMIAPFAVLASTLIGASLLLSVGLLQLGFAVTLVVAAALSTAVVSFFRLRRENRQRKQEFLAALEDLDLATLQHSTMSPLVDDVSRQLLVTYLNQRYPGWCDHGRI